MRLPVAANTALHNAGASGGTGGSPTPPQKSPLGTTTVSTLGASAMRSISCSSKFPCTAAPSLDGDFAVKGGSQRVDNRALGLHFDRERIDHIAGIER